MFGATRAQSNLDGTRTIRCPQCTRALAKITATAMVGSALCVLCQERNKGHTPTAEEIAYLTQGQTRPFELEVVVKETDPMVKDLDNDKVVGRVEYFVRVLKDKAAKIAEAIVEPPSKTLAKEKRSPRIFDRPVD